MPENEKEFEDRTAILFQQHVSDPNLKGVATRGKDQGGLDLIGCRNGDASQPVGVQCKLRTKGNRLLAADAQSDIERALALEPALTEIYVVTTADDDLELDKLALRFMQAELEKGRKVQIAIWGWTEMQRRIRTFSEALQAFDPEYSASTNQLLAYGRESLVVGHRLEGRTDHMFEMVRALYDKNIVADPGTGPAVEKLLDEQVDEYRHLLNSGKPSTALDMLERMEAKLQADASAAIRSRIQANIGFAHMRLGDEKKASEALFRAFELNPTDPKAKANRLLALIFEDRPAEAVAEAQKILNEDPANAAAASYAYQAAGLTPDCDPDMFVPGDLRTDENTAINRMNLLRGRDRIEWRDAAKELFERHPGNGVAKRFAAEALLDEAYANQRSLLQMSENQRRDLIERGTTMLQEHWDEVRLYENASEEGWLGVGVNLITAYRAMRDVEGAQRTIAQTLALKPNDPGALTAAAQMDVILDHAEDAVAKVQSLPDDPARTLVLAMAYTDLKRWGDIVALVTPERRDAVREADRRLLDMVHTRALIETSQAEDPNAALDALIAQWPDDSTILISVAGIASDRGLVTAEARLKLAEDAMGDFSPFTDRVMLAQLGMRRDDFNLVIRTLDYFVATDAPNEPLAWLALSFANAPLRPRSKTFFDGLPSTVIETAGFARLASAVEIRRGDLPSAERHLRLAVRENPSDLRAALMFIDVLRRRDKTTEARTFIREAEEKVFEGSDLEKMQFAMQLRESGEGERALELGYSVASNARDKGAVVSMYPSLFFFNESLPPEVSATQIVIGSWFELEGRDCKNVSGLIQDGETPEVASHSPTTTFARAILGHVIDDEICLPQGIGPDRHYRVAAIKHRYVWLLHDIMDSLSTRFPDSTSVGEMSVVDGDVDVEPVFDIIRQQEEHRQAILTTYQQLAVPLTALAIANNKSVLEIAELIPQMEGDIHTCIGSLEERTEAERFAEKAKGKGAALDTLTAWLSHHLGLLPSLKTWFGRLAVSQQTIDELLMTRGRIEINRGREYMTLGFEGDQRVRTIHSPEETEARIALFTTTIDAIKANCDVLPVDGEDELADSTLEHREVIDRMMDPVHLAKQHRLLLLTDDLRLRQLALRYGVRSSWLQAVGLLLRRKNEISGAQYARAVGLLAVRRHTHVSLDGQTLTDIMSIEDDPANRLFDASINFIGGPKADMYSHIVAVADFMNQIWAAPVPSWVAGRAIDKLLWRLLSGRYDQWEIILSTLNALVPSIRRFPFTPVERSREYLHS